MQLAEEKEAYDEATRSGPKYSPGTAVDLNMRVLLVHGDEVIADTDVDGSLAEACQKYKKWLVTL